MKVYAFTAKSNLALIFDSKTEHLILSWFYLIFVGYRSKPAEMKTNPNSRLHLAIICDRSSEELNPYHLNFKYNIFNWSCCNRSEFIRLLNRCRRSHLIMEKKRVEGKFYKDQKDENDEQNSKIRLNCLIVANVSLWTWSPPSEQLILHRTLSKQAR